MIHVVATIELAPGTREAFLAEFHRIVPLVKAETGCLDYGPTVDVPTGIPAQGAVRDDTDPVHSLVRDAVERREVLTVEVLYTDQEGSRRFITRFTLTPRDDGWTAAAGRLWVLD